jgi:hypothetical protein
MPDYQTESAAPKIRRFWRATYLKSNDIPMVSPLGKQIADRKSG